MQNVWIRASLIDSDCERQMAARQWPKQFKAMGLEMRELTPSIGAAIGTSGHAVFEAQLRHKALTGIKPEYRHGLKEATELLYKTCDAGITYDSGVTKDRVTAAVQLENMAREFNAEYLPYHGTLSARIGDTEQLVLEQEYSMFWDSQRTVLLTARPDNVTRTKQVHDFKTGAREPVMPMQAALQAMILRNLDIPAEGLASIWLPRKTAKMKVIEYPIDSAIEEAEYQIDRTVRVYQEFQKERTPLVFKPNPKSYNCSADYCPLYGTKSCPLMEGKSIE